MDRRDFLRLSPVIAPVFVGCATNEFRYIGLEEIRARRGELNIDLVQWLLLNKELIEREAKDTNDYHVGPVEIRVQNRVTVDEREVSMGTKWDLSSNNPHVVLVSLTQIPPTPENPERLSVHTIKGVYAHELGHVATGETGRLLYLQGSLDRDYSIYFSRRSKLEEGLERRITVVFEGIAYVFSNRTTGSRVANFPWPSRVEGLYEEDQLHGLAHMVVEPIIDKLGTRPGIMAMLSKPPPTAEELLEPAQYEQRILDR